MVNRYYNLITHPLTSKKYSIISYTGKKIYKYIYGGVLLVNVGDN